MNRRSALQRMAAAGAGCFLPRILAESKPEEDFTLRSEARLVLLDVSVQDDQRNFVTGLSKDSFVLTEDGRSQTITAFDREDLPVTVGILIDESRSMGPKRTDVLQAATALIQESNPLDEVFVLNFNDRVMPGLAQDKLFSGDIGELRAALYRGFPQGKTALYDAVAEGLQQLDLGRQNRKTLVLISDGGDNASEHNRHDVLDRVQKSFATIYTIGLYDADDPDRNPAILEHLANISGGEAYFPNDPLDAVPICRRIATEIRARYTIGYRPEGSSGKERLRHVRIRASAPGHEHLHVRARETYRL